ncbi:MAG: CHAT domain-containing protein [Planctomycetes bacterium]|nr:CHAT domain-containing protein [Planctomycetota bacterium]
MTLPTAPLRRPLCRAAPWLAATLGACGPGEPAPVAPREPVAAETAVQHPLRALGDRLRAAADADARLRALAELRRGLAELGERLALDPERRADDPDLTAWLDGFGQLASFARAGWPADAVQLALDVRGVASRARPSGVASAFEAELTAWLLRQRAEGGSQQLRELPLAELAAVEDLGRYVSGAREAYAWTLILLGVELRGDGDVGLALHALAAAERAVAAAARPSPVAACYVAMERASCYQQLGRAEAASAALVDAQRTVVDWQPTTDALRATRAELEVTVGLARVRQACLDGRFALACRWIVELRERSPRTAVVAQLSYYESVARQGLGEGDVAASALTTALASPDLAPAIRSLALLDDARNRLGVDADAGALDAARRSLDAHARLLAEQPADAWPLPRAREAGLRARLARLTALRATDRDPTAELVAAHATAGAAFDAFLAAWESSEDGLGIGTLAFQPRRALLDEVIELSLLTGPRDGRERRALEQTFRAPARGALARSLCADPAPTFDRVRAALLTEPGTILLVLAPGADCTHAFVADRERVEHERLPTVEHLQSAVRALWRELAATPPAGDLADARARAGAAARALAGPLFTAHLAERIRAARRILFAGGELLERAPLAALPCGELGPLGLAREIVELPSVSVGLALAARRAPAAPPALLALVAPAAAPDARGDTPEAIRFPPDERTALAGSCASLGWFDGPEARLERLAGAGAADALLVFGHGVTVAGLARPRGVALTPSPALPDGRLVPERLEAAGLAMPPVVLLAVCDATGTDPMLGSDDADHLAASLFRAGARTVFAAPCPLEQVATARLAVGVLAGMAAGRRPAAALVEARRALRGDPRYDHPHFWATWSAIGW